jgi:magnesium transporter
VRRGGEELRLDLAPDEIAKALQDPESLVWVDIAADGRVEGETILRDVFGFHPLTIDDCYNTLIDPPKVDDYGDYLFIIVHNITYDEADERLSAGELNLYLGENYVVSVHRSPVRAVEDVRQRAEKHALVLQKGAAFLAHALIDVVVDDFHPIVERIDEQVSVIEELVIDHPRRETLERVLRLKRNAQRLKRSILPQRDVINRLSRNEYPHRIPQDAMMYFRDIYDHTVRVDEAIEGVRDLADSALSTYLSSVNNRINEVMKTLAIVTVIFLPLTLIAGIYGTNFENVPEYGLRLGYPGMLIGMVALAAALIGWFKLRGWF